MKLQTLNYFLQLSKMENLSQTADYFNISQPALSKQIKLLENELNLQLFDRFGNHLRLNVVGRQYASYVERALQLLNSGKEYTRKMRYEMTGCITLSFLMPESLFTPCISSYANLNPNVQFHLRRQEAGREIPLAEETDFILYSHEAQQQLPRKTWCSDLLMEERYMVVMAQNHPLCKAFKMTSDLTLLQEASFITTGCSRGYGQDITIQLCANAGFYPKVRLQTDDLLATIGLIAQGAGISFLSESCVPQVHSLASELQVIPVDGCRRCISMAHQREELMTEAAQDFMAYMLDYYGERTYPSEMPSLPQAVPDTFGIWGSSQSPGVPDSQNPC